MDRLPTGTWAAINYEAIQEARRMQAVALKAMEEEWRTEPETVLVGQTPEQILDEILATDASPEARAALNEKYREVLRPLLEMVFAPPEQQQGPTNGTA